MLCHLSEQVTQLWPLLPSSKLLHGTLLSFKGNRGDRTVASGSTLFLHLFLLMRCWGLLRCLILTSLLYPLSKTNSYKNNRRALEMSTVNKVLAIQTWGPKSRPIWKCGPEGANQQPKAGQGEAGTSRSLNSPASSVCGTRERYIRERPKLKTMWRTMEEDSQT